MAGAKQKDQEKEILDREVKPEPKPVRLDKDGNTDANDPQPAQ